MVWHGERKEDVAKELQTQPKLGLTEFNVSVRLKEYGGNVRVSLRRRSGFAAFMGKLLAPLSLGLTAFSVLWIFLLVWERIGTGVDAVTELFDPMMLCPLSLLTTVIVLAAVRTARELSATGAIIEMNDSSTAYSRVRRGSVIKEVPSEQLVPGDIVQIEAGDVIPADGRLLITSSFTCDESTLTGSDKLIVKDSDAVLGWDTPLEERVNMVYAGTAAVSGRALMIITETGMNTQAAKSSGKKLRKLKLHTPVISSARRARNLSIWAVFCLSLTMIVTMVMRLRPFTLPGSFDEIWLFLTARANGFSGNTIFLSYLFGEYPYDPVLLNVITELLQFITLLAICAVPLGLPQNVMQSLAVGMKKLRRSGAFLRDYQKAELIGTTTLICTDKTGTLTRNEMTVAKAWPVGDTPAAVDEGFWSDEMKYLMKCSALCCDSKLLYDYEGRPIYTGDQTEAAIVSAFVENGGDMDGLLEQYPRRASIPFDSSRKLMTVIHEIDGLYMAVTKGAPDVLAPKCINADAAEINAHIREMCDEGLRVIAVAVQVLDKLPDEVTPEAVENEMIFIGLIGLDDPCREDVKKSVRECAAAGIRTVMMTGDHPATAAAVARRLGIMEEHGAVLTGEKLAAMSDRKLRAKLSHYAVFARISPEDKVRLIKVWQEKGERVLMAAGGMGDAPALRTAQVSCAMEETATDIAARAADVTLSGNNFVSIRRLVKMGRTIRQNITKLSEFSLTCCIAQTAILLGGRLLYEQSVFCILPLVLLNLLLFVFVQPFFADEPPEKDIMRAVPSDESNLTGMFEKMRALLGGGFIAFNALLVYWLAERKMSETVSYQPGAYGPSALFVFMALSLVLYGLCVRSNRPFVITAVVRNRGLLLGSLAVVLTVLVMTMYGGAAAVLGFNTSFLTVLREMGLLLGLELFVWQYPKFYGYVSGRRYEK